MSNISKTVPQPNIRQGHSKMIHLDELRITCKKNFPGANTLAYFVSMSVKHNKSLIFKRKDNSQTKD